MEMDADTAGAIGGLVQVGAGLLGEWWASSSDEERKALAQQAFALYGDISPPTLERVLAEALGPSAMEGISRDQGNRSARDLAIQRMMEMGLSDGMDPGSQLALEQGRRAAALHEQQGRGAVFAESRRRGLGGAGELAAQLQAQQSGADRASMAGTQAAADARSRALAALAQGGGMAGQAEGQDFERAARIAESQDRIDQFNAGMAERAKYYNAGLGQREFENEMMVRDSKSRALLGQSEMAGSEAERRRKTAGGVGQGLGYAIGALGQAYGGGGQQQGPSQYTNYGGGQFGGYGYGYGGRR